ncbi:MAG: radical SAM protein [Clostridia bacterium]|nr:radical SAM protein [Clostridia bacterium]
MEKIKRFIDCYIPTETCNLRCHYCYITQCRKFNNKMVKFDYDASYIRKALSIKRLGGVCLLNLCAGGETLLSDEIIPVVKELLEEGHYVMIVTNGTLTKRFDEIAKLEKNLLNRLFFKFSFHYLELLRLNMLDTFINNINKMKKSGCSYTIEITPSDELIPYIDEIKEICKKEFGCLCHITIGRNDTKRQIEVLSKYSFEEYKKIWSVFDSELFDFKSEIFYVKRKEFCYAGDWMLYLNLATGEIKQCYKGLIIQNIYKDITEPIETLAIGNLCREPHCYNGHAFLTLGIIPELQTPTYAKLRNRISNNGTEWLRKDVSEFMKCKLKDNNSKYGYSKKIYTNIKNVSKILPRKIYNKLLKKYW